MQTQDSSTLLFKHSTDSGGVCIGKSDLKKIDDSIDKPYYDRMHQRLQTVSREKIRQLRGSTVEPVLGTLVNYMGMQRVNTRGIQQSNKCMLMAAVAYNLKKLMKFTARKVQADVKAMQQSLQAAFLIVFSCMNFHSEAYTLHVVKNKWESIICSKTLN